LLLVQKNLREGGIRVGDEHFKVGLKPGTSFWCGLLGIGETAVGIVAWAAGVASTVTFTTWLDPDDSIDQAGASARRWARAETSVVDVAPITPGVADVLDTRSSLVNDEVSREVILCQKGCQGGYVEHLVVIWITGGDRISGGSD